MTAYPCAKCDGQTVPSPRIGRRRCLACTLEFKFEQPIFMPLIQADTGELDETDFRVMVHLTQSEHGEDIDDQAADDLAREAAETVRRNLKGKRGR